MDSKWRINNIFIIYSKFRTASTPFPCLGKYWTVKCRTVYTYCLISYLPTKDIPNIPGLLSTACMQLDVLAL